MGKYRSLKSFFTEYLIVMMVAVVADLLVCMLLLYAGVVFGVLVSQNQTETQISQREPFIQKALKVEASDIPKSCRYAVIKKDGTYLYGDVSKKQAQIAYQMYQENRSISNGVLMTGLGANCYYRIERNDEICSLMYTAGTQYQSKKMQDYFISPELAIMGVGGILLLLEVFFVSTFYGKKIAKKLVPLQNATDEISRQNLEFEIAYSGMKEIDAILHSMEELKENLKEALLNNWNTENLKEMQIGALAHDLKTPLTLVIGNTELLADTSLSSTQQNLVQTISINANHLEEYIQMLHQLVSTKNGIDFCKKEVGTELFFKQLVIEMQMMVKLEHMNLVTDVLDQIEKGALPGVLYMDEIQIKRALLNIVSNAIDYSKPKQSIYFKVDQKDKQILFQIKDEGVGFSLEDTKHATEQFYQGDDSRTRKFHYGMGLYIAKVVAQNHGGEVKIENQKSKGAMVSFYIINEP